MAGFGGLRAAPPVVEGEVVSAFAAGGHAAGAAAAECGVDHAVGDGPRRRFHEGVGREVAGHVVDVRDNHFACFEFLVDPMKIIGRVRRIDFGRAGDGDLGIDRRGVGAAGSGGVMAGDHAVFEFGIVLEDRFAVRIDVGEAEDLFAPGEMPLRSRKIGSGDVDVGDAGEFGAAVPAFGSPEANLLAVIAIATRWGLTLVDSGHSAGSQSRFLTTFPLKQFFP